MSHNSQCKYFITGFLFYTNKILFSLQSLNQSLKCFSRKKGALGVKLNQ